MQRNGGFPHCSPSDPLKIHSKHIERIGKMKKVKFTYDEIQALMIVLTEFRNMLMEEALKLEDD